MTSTERPAPHSAVREGADWDGKPTLEIEVGRSPHDCATVWLSTGRALNLARQIANAARLQQRKRELGECPWYISAQAVRDYIAVRRMRDPEGERTFAIAEQELMQIAETVVASGKEPKPQRDGSVQYRGPKPHRLNLIVREEPRPEGPKPQLVHVVKPGASR